MITDEELLAQVAAGKEEGLELLVYRYHKPIFAYLYRLMLDRERAKDLTQECFARLVESVRKQRLPSRFRPWFYKLATNLCKDVWKSAAYRRETLTKQPIGELDQAQDSIASIMDRQWEREQVIAALEDLPEDERKVVILRFYQELKLDEIADVLEMPLSTIKTKLYRAFKNLANQLTEEGSGQSWNGERSTRAGYGQNCRKSRSGINSE